MWQTAVAAIRTTASSGPAAGTGRPTSSTWRGAASPAPRISPGITCSARLEQPRVPGQRIDHGDLLDREVGDDLDPVLVYDQHLLDAHAPLEALAVLGLERENHAFLDLDRVIERPDARDDRLVVLREPEPVPPQVGRGLILLLVAPRFFRRRPLRRDLARSRADLYRLDRVVEPLECGGVDLLLLLARLPADAVGAVVAGLVAVPRQRREVHEHDLAGLDDPIGEVAPVGPGVRPRGDDDVLHVLHARNRVEELHDVRRDLVLGEAGLEELHALPVRRVADRADHAQAFLLVLVLDRARLHHRRHAVGPVELRVLERLQHVDVDEVDAELAARDVRLLHLLHDGVRELLHLLRGGGPRGALDPGVGPAHVVFGNPRRVALDLEPDVTLLEQHRRIVAAQHRVAQPGLEPVPAGSEGAGHVADVLVVHEQHRAQPVGLHPLPRPLGAIVAQAVPVDALLPVQPDHPEICHVSSTCNAREHTGPIRPGRYLAYDKQERSGYRDI